MKEPRISVGQGANQMGVEEQLKVGAEVLRCRGRVQTIRNRNRWEVRVYSKLGVGGLRMQV